jgi:hypothetical protein
MSWPAYIVGAFFMALLIYDIVTNDWIDVPFHAVLGLVLTGIYMLISMFVSDTIAGAALLIPAVALIGFMVAAWMSGESLKSRGCCVRCDGVDGNSEIEESEETISSTKTGSKSKSTTLLRRSNSDSGTQDAEDELSNSGSNGASGSIGASGRRSSDIRASSCPQKLNATPLV